MLKPVKVGKITFGGNTPFVLIAGPCVIENRRIVFETASSIKELASRMKVPFIFKASYDKANRTSISSFRGPGLKEGLDILREVKEKLKTPILSDVHSVDEIPSCAEVLDILQIPAFLCRQTDLIIAAAKTGKVINIKKGQFLAPWDMKAVAMKARAAGNRNIILTERGVSFGYNNLVSDFRSLEILRDLDCPVVFDATHSVQQPGGLCSSSGGQSEFVPLLARCAVAAGCDGIFMEIHPNPKKALSDGANMLPLFKLESLLTDLIAIDKIVKKGKRKK